MYAIIGGSGIYSPGMLNEVLMRKINTPFGIVHAICGKLNDINIVFMPRHGVNHSVPPHMINYRANMWALKSVGVTRIVSTSAVGSLKEPIKPGSYVVLSDFLDFTKRRPLTFYEGTDAFVEEKDVVHIDVTNPYCPQLREVVIRSGNKIGLSMIPKGVYVCTEGPRFETAAEVRMFSGLGGDVVGMTNVPEVILARELEMCYSSVAMVTNYAAGTFSDKLTHTEVLDIMEKNKESINKLLLDVIPSIPLERTCKCEQALLGAKG